MSILIMNSDTRSWINTLTEKVNELELIASWASIVEYGKVRDYCRKAKYELVEKIRRLKENEL